MERYSPSESSNRVLRFCRFLAYACGLSELDIPIMIFPSAEAYHNEGIARKVETIEEWRAWRPKSIPPLPRWLPELRNQNVHDGMLINGADK